MKRRFILYMMIGLIFKSSQFLAQSEKPVLSNINSINAPNSIGLAIGLNTGAFQDLHFSPLIYQEIGPAYNLNYRKKKENKRRLWTANLFFSNGKLTTEASDLLECRYIIADIEVACLKQLNETKEKFDFYIGAGYHLDFGVIIFNDVLQSFTFLVAHSLDLKGQVNYELNEKNELLGSLSLPLATLLVRPPYSRAVKF